MDDAQFTYAHRVGGLTGYFRSTMHLRRTGGGLANPMNGSTGDMRFMALGKSAAPVRERCMFELLLHPTGYGLNRSYLRRFCGLEERSRVACSGDYIEFANGLKVARRRFCDRFEIKEELVCDWSSGGVVT